MLYVVERRAEAEGGEPSGIEIMTRRSAPGDTGRRDVGGTLPAIDRGGEGHWDRSIRSPAQGVQGRAPTYLMRAAKQPVRGRAVVERKLVREGSNDGAPEQELKEGTGHVEQGPGGRSGTGFSGFARRESRARLLFAYGDFPHSCAIFS